MKNLISFREGFIVGREPISLNLDKALDIQTQLEVYGYTFDREAFDNLKYWDAADLTKLYEDVVEWLKQVTGGAGFTPLYADFPNHLNGTTEPERRYDQFIHYWTGRVVGPTVTKEVAEEAGLYKEIRLGTQEEFEAIPTKILSVGNSITAYDQKVLKWFLAQGNVKYPSSIPFKENLVWVVVNDPQFTVRTPIDVLRVAIAFSGGDVSMPPVPKKKSKRGKEFDFKLNPEQKERLFKLFEKCSLDLGDMNQGRKYGRFIRLFEVLGPVPDQYPRTLKAITNLRNQKRAGKPDGVPKIRGFYSRYESAVAKALKPLPVVTHSHFVTLNKKESEIIKEIKAFQDRINDSISNSQGISGVIQVLSERPGEFSRRISFLIEKFPDDIQTMREAFVLMAPKSSTKVLLELWNYLENHKNGITDINTRIKGTRENVKREIKPIPAKTAANLQLGIQDALVSKWSELESIGNVYLDEKLKMIPIPSDMRSMQESMIPRIRGQKVPIVKTDGTLRVFIHWFNSGKRICDIDLGAWLCSKEGMYFVGWNGSRDNPDALYSGDITNREGACAEYIDLNIPKLRKDYTHVVIDLRDFKALGFDTYEQCVLGFQEVSHPEANQNWIPKTLSNSVLVNTKARGTIPVIIDLSDMTYIVVDEDTDGPVAQRNYEGVQRLLKLASNHALSVYDILDWHVQARGKLVRQEEADTQFVYSDFSGSYKKIMEFLK